MGQLVVNTAVCMCAMGVAPCTLVFLPTHMVTGSKQPAANIMDNIPFLNVSGFAMCNSQANPATAAATAAAWGVPTPGPCTPVLPAPWTPGAIKTTIAKMPALDSTSVLNCAYGGVITISFAGEATISVS